MPKKKPRKAVKKKPAKRKSAPKPDVNQIAAHIAKEATK